MQGNSKECMKMAMLKHEETFREQVSELHRLYQVQRMLMMRDLERQKEEYAFFRSNFGRWNGDVSLRMTTFDLERSADADSNDGCPPETELTLATGSRGERRKKKKEDRPFTSDSGPSFSSSSSSSAKSGRENLKLQDWGLCKMPSISLNYFGEEIGFNVGEGMRKDRLLKQPSWHTTTSSPVVLGCLRL